MRPWFIAPVAPSAVLASLLVAACGGDEGPRATDGGDGTDAPQPDAPTPDAGCPTGTPDYPLLYPDFGADSPPLPSGGRLDGGLPAFLWGAATAGHQVEGGNRASDWWAWEQMEGRITGGDRSDDGPDHWTHYERDMDLLVAGGMNAYRMSIEWARLFPRREDFEADPMRPDVEALARYRDIVRAARARGITLMVTLHHFVSPIWWLDPRAPLDERRAMGFASDRAPEDLRRWADFVGRQFGADVDLWVTLNEPMVLLLAGYLVGRHPPGIVYEPGDELPLRVVRNLIRAHAAAYDALHAADTVDADGDGRAALVSVAQHLRPLYGLRPCSVRDATAARRLEHLNNWVLLDAIVRGDLDGNGDGDLDDPGDVRADPALVGRADYLGINYYSLTLVDGSVPLSDLIPGLPLETERHTGLAHTDLEWSIYPGGFRVVLEEAWRRYRLPIHVTENGVADATGALRGRFVAEHLHVLARAMADGIDVRGYFHWTLMDNFEWSEGFCPRFGLYRVNYESPDRTRTETDGLRVLRRILGEGRVTATLLAELPPYGAPSVCR